jgi:hypothetical protein
MKEGHLTRRFNALLSAMAKGVPAKKTKPEVQTSEQVTASNYDDTQTPGDTFVGASGKPKRKSPLSPASRSPKKPR